MCACDILKAPKLSLQFPSPHKQQDEDRVVAWWPKNTKGAKRTKKWVRGTNLGKLYHHRLKMVMVQQPRSRFMHFISQFGALLVMGTRGSLFFSHSALCSFLCLFVLCFVVLLACCCSDVHILLQIRFS